MITFELIKDKTVYNGQEFNDLPAAARFALKGEDQPFQAVRDGMVCLTGKSTRKVAKLRIVDEKYVKYPLLFGGSSDSTGAPRA